MKTTKEGRSKIRAILAVPGFYGTIPLPFSPQLSDLCDDADEAERLEAENANLKQIQQDNIDAENDWRAASGEWDKSDSLCTESAATIIERIKAENAQLRKRLEAYDECVKRLYHDAID